MIKVEHLYKSFDGVPVLKDINVEYHFFYQIAVLQQRSRAIIDCL